MKTSEFFYELPQELIAQDPLEDRSASRLLFLDRASGSCSHETFRQLPGHLREGDCLVLNDTKVIPARLLGVRKGTGAAVEVLLLKRKGDGLWETLVRPGKKCRKGAELLFGADADGKPLTPGGPVLSAVVEQVLEDGNRLIRFSFSGIFEEILDRLGQMPLPPYITHELKDRDRYQTVYARYEGSAAAPTAGLHFTEEILNEIRGKGVRIVPVTLHVGLGTFRPVKAEDIRDHHMHSEYYVITEQAADEINTARAAGGRIVCVGTTSCRTLETAAGEDGVLRAGAGWTDIFLYPGYRFRIMDGLITNFHLPESTLLMLVSAFAGKEAVLAAYEEAVKERYRFFSFGDAMLIL